jgi:predicted nucleic acid-binding protein
MARYLLDSDAVIDYANKIQPSVQLIRGLSLTGNTLCVCSTVVAEAFSGFRSDMDQLAEAFVMSCEFLTTSADAAVQAGRWRFFYARQGIRLATTDTLIAATALEHHTTLVTANVRHYPMPELSLLPLPR